MLKCLTEHFDQCIMIQWFLKLGNNAAGYLLNQEKPSKTVDNLCFNH